MTHIKIVNVGAIKKVDLNIKKINIFMGPQSSGKSTIAKILCHCQWVEKSCFSNLHNPLKYYQDGTNFYDSLVEYHRLKGYFREGSCIEYSGDYVKIEYNHSQRKAVLTLTGKGYEYPKISYVPSERNIVAAIPNLEKYNDSNDVILYFMFDWFTSRKAINSQSFQELLNHKLSYQYRNETDYVVDDGNELLLANASSGVQSLIPLYLVLYYSLETIYSLKRPLSFEQRESVSYLNELYSNLVSDSNNGNVGVDEVKKMLKSVGEGYCSKYKDVVSLFERLQRQVNEKYSYSYSSLFVEEPEQNLFPSTQQSFVYWLISLLQKSGNRKNSLLLTTHSPYVLFAINNCMMGKLVEKNIPKNKLSEFADCCRSWVSPKDVGVYEIEEGFIRCIQDEEGIIEDNYLNEAYKENAAEYMSLLNYYEDEE